MMLRGFMAIAIASAVWAAEESKLTREGDFWVQTITGSEAAAPGGRLRVTTNGQVSVRGADDSQVQYVVNKRVKAKTEREARELLRFFAVKAYRQGDLSVITVAHAGEGRGTSELKITAPRGMRESIVETRGGPIDAADLNGALRVSTGGGPIRLDRINGMVIATTAGGEINLGNMGGSVRCTSAGGPIRAGKIAGEAILETAGGDITAGEVGGPLRASTAGGAVYITQAGASVTVSTAGGAIDVGAARGMVHAESNSGAIRIGAANGVQCDTGGGAIRLSNVTGALRASTSVGNVIAQLLAGGRPEDSVLITDLGDITVFVPSNLGIRILAQIDSGGKIVSDFPQVKLRTGNRQVAEGDVNGGGPLLRLSSDRGTIYIRRQK
jgi:hypothetical protein